MSDREDTWRRLCGRVTFPPALPVSARAEEIAGLLRTHRTVIVAGETGSGKTTQVPKCCLLAGLGRRGDVVMTQPRRLAATRTALRLSEELSCRLGEEIGYRIRFAPKVSGRTILQVVTDGILLSGDLGSGPFRRLSAVIVDEVHERSVNIDLLLGLLKLARRTNPELRVVLMSATADLALLQGFFPEAATVLVEGRTHPVDIVHRDERGEPGSAAEETAEAILELHAAQDLHGGTLAFLPTERDILECQKELSRRLPESVQVLPLFSRLPQAEQDRVFRDSGLDRVILATNVAETSLTIPGIRLVVDAGWVRTMRHHPERGVSRLELERVSKSSARQRAGRAGRLGPGRCLRLYSGQVFESLPEFPVPEIRRTDLSVVLLKLASSGIRDPRAFPFPEPPRGGHVDGALRELAQLRAIGVQRGRMEITPLGRRMVELPLPPRLGHVMVAAVRERLVLPCAVVAAFLSIQDPRLSPAEDLEKARGRHRRFHVPGSDLLGLLRLFLEYAERQAELSSRKLRAWCQEEYLSFQRMREWSQLAAELSGRGRARDLDELRSVDRDRLHRLFLASHPFHLMQRDAEAERTRYRSGSRQGILAHPSSSSAGASPDWLCCAEFLQTYNLYALHAWEVDPAWLIELCPHLLSYEHGDPRFDADTQKAVCEERVLMNGHVLRTRPRVDAFKRDPEKATAAFLREGLLPCALRWRHMDQVAAFLERLRQLDAARRVRDLLAGEEHLVAWFREGLGPCGRLNDLERRGPGALRLDPAAYAAEFGAADALRDYPATLAWGGEEIPVIYRHAPGKDDDGATAPLTESLLLGLPAGFAERAVPGLLRQRLGAARDRLPERLKQGLADPVEGWLAAFLQERSSLAEFLAGELAPRFGKPDELRAWIDTLPRHWPPHLSLRLEVRDRDGRVVACGRDQEGLRRLRLEHGLAAARLQAIKDFRRPFLQARELAQPGGQAGRILKCVARMEGRAVPAGSWAGGELSGHPCLEADGGQVWKSLRFDPDEARASSARVLLEALGFPRAEPPPPPAALARAMEDEGVGRALILRRIRRGVFERMLGSVDRAFLFQPAPTLERMLVNLERSRLDKDAAEVYGVLAGLLRLRPHVRGLRGWEPADAILERIHRERIGGALHDPEEILRRGARHYRMWTGFLEAMFRERSASARTLERLLPRWERLVQDHEALEASELSAGLEGGTGGWVHAYFTAPLPPAGEEALLREEAAFASLSERHAAFVADFRRQEEAAGALLRARGPGALGPWAERAARRRDPRGFVEAMRRTLRRLPEEERRPIEPPRPPALDTARLAGSLARAWKAGSRRGGNPAPT